MKIYLKILLVAVYVAHSCARPQPGAPATPPAAPAKPPAAPAAPAAAPGAAPKALAKAEGAMAKAVAAGTAMPDTALEGADLAGHTALNLLISEINMLTKGGESLWNKEMKIAEDFITLL